LGGGETRSAAKHGGQAGELVAK